MMRTSVKGRPAANTNSAQNQRVQQPAPAQTVSNGSALAGQIPLLGKRKPARVAVEKHPTSGLPARKQAGTVAHGFGDGEGTEKVEGFTTDLLSIIQDLKARIPWEGSDDDKQQQAASNLPPLTRKYLHDTLRIYEDKILKIRTGIRLLSNERDQSYTLLSDCRKEISRLNAELKDWKAFVLKNETSVTVSPNNNNKTRGAADKSGVNLRHKLEEQWKESKKIQALEQELNWLQLERRELLARLKLATDETIRKSLDEDGRIKLLTTELENERMTREKLLQEKCYLESKNHELETDVKFVKDKEIEARKEAFYQENLYKEYGQMLTEKEDMTRQFQQRLAEREYALKTAKQQINRLDKRVQALELDIKQLEAEKSQVRGAVRRMTHEADSMQRLADDKSVELAQLRKDLERKERELTGCAERLHQVEEENRFYHNESARHTDTLQSLRTQQEQALGSLNKASLEADRLRAQVKQLEEQLRTVRNETKLTKEHQEEVLGEKERIRFEMQTYAEKVREAERRLEQLENEKKSADEKYTAITDKYRQVAEDLERAERRSFNTDRVVKEKEGETERLKLQLGQLDEQLKQVREAAVQHRRMQTDYEKELEQIRAKFSSTETEKVSVERDLRDQRENNNLLTLRNTEIMEQLNKKHDELMKDLMGFLLEPEDYVQTLASYQSSSIQRLNQASSANSDRRNATAMRSENSHHSSAFDPTALPFYDTNKTKNSSFILPKSDISTFPMKTDTSSSTTTTAAKTFSLQQTTRSNNNIASQYETFLVAPSTPLFTSANHDDRPLSRPLFSSFNNFDGDNRGSVHASPPSTFIVANNNTAPVASAVNDTIDSVLSMDDTAFVMPIATSTPRHPRRASASEAGISISSSLSTASLFRGRKNEPSAVALAPPLQRNDTFDVVFPSQNNAGMGVEIDRTLIDASSPSQGRLAGEYVHPRSFTHLLD